MKRSLLYTILMIAVLAGLNLLARCYVCRWDLTEDKRYTLSAETRSLVSQLDDEVEVTLLLGGKLNASFLQLQSATCDMLAELSAYGPIRATEVQVDALPDGSPLKAVASRLHPTVIHERADGGQTVQTLIYPYAVVHRGGNKPATAIVPLLQNTRGVSGQENINRSIEQLEFAFAEALCTISRGEKEAVAFLEGHGELPEANVQDLEDQLSRYFAVYRGQLTDDATMLDAYKVLIIADPQLPFSDRDKYLLDQYVMHGGRILWALNGARFSQDYLASDGTTPVIAADLGLNDLLFRHGIRVEPVLLQDQQCLPIPVNVSEDESQPNFQPLPWTYAPLLLTADASPITTGLGPVSSSFCSVVSAVGEDEKLRHEVLLASSDHSALTGVPAEVNLSDLNPDPSRFVYQYLPVAMLVEGVFPSLYAHRATPDGLQHVRELRKESERTAQIVVASGSVLRNEVQQGQPLPLGFDRYTGMQFANRDFAVNAVLYLSDDAGLMRLRRKSFTLRLLSDAAAREQRRTIQFITTISPLLVLALTALLVLLGRKKKYQR